MMSLPVWLPGPMFLLCGEGGLCTWSYVLSEGGVSVKRISVKGGLCERGVSVKGVSEKTPVATEAGGTHSTGMHTCSTKYSSHNCRSILFVFY